MSDDVLRKAEAYIDSCIAAMDRPPSAAQRKRAIELVEDHTRKLLRVIRS